MYEYWLQFTAASDRAVLWLGDNAHVLVGVMVALGAAFFVGCMIYAAYVYTLRLTKYLVKKTKYYVRMGWHRFRRGTRMTKLQRQQLHEKSVVADYIVDAMENAYFNGDLSRKSVKYWYKRMGNLFDIPDLLPKGQATLKQYLLKQRQSPDWGKVRNIPGPPPLQEVKSNVYPLVKPAAAPKNRLEAIFASRKVA